jgi:hypothetical protein
VTTVFDNSTLSWTVKVEGTDFTGTTSDVSLEIDNVAQTTTSVSTTEAIFTITNVSSQALTNNMLYFDVGLPQNHSLVAAQLDITPRLVSITPNTGSIGGTVITAIMPGATTTDTNIYIKKVGGTQSICQGPATVVSYGVVECKTKAEIISDGTLLYV